MKDNYMTGLHDNSLPDIPLNVFLNIVFNERDQPLILQLEKNVCFWEYMNDILQQNEVVIFDPKKSKFCQFKTPFIRKIEYDPPSCEEYLYNTFLRCILQEVDDSNNMRLSALSGTCAACKDEMWGARGKLHFYI